MGNTFSGFWIASIYHCAEILLSDDATFNVWQGAGPDVKVRNAIKLIEDDGWSLVATRGSHRQYKHLVKPGRVTIAGKLSDELAPGTWNSILKQAGLKEAR